MASGRTARRSGYSTAARTTPSIAYDLESGEFIAEYVLDDANGDPRGIWSDRVTVWVSDHGAKRLFAYRLPALEDAEDAAEEAAGDAELERVRDEEFTKLSRASNNSPRGIWSDGEVMYVADESDDKVYSYNLPGAIDARLASLTLSGIDIGEFSAAREEYEGVAAEGVTETTVMAEALQPRATVAIDPPDADEDAENGRQAAVEDGTEITVTVISEDGSRTRVYSVRIGGAAEESAGELVEEDTGVREPSADCLRGLTPVTFSLAIYEGGSVDELAACARGQSVSALYTQSEGRWIVFLLDAPPFVNVEFRAFFADGLAPITPIIAKREPPPEPAEPDTGSAGS